MQDWLIQLVTEHPYILYAIVVVIACAEGPILSMIFGVLLKLGYVKFWPIYTALMLGDLVGDVVWYYIGYHFGHRFTRRFGKYFNITEASVEKVKKIFHRYKHRILFISKISNGFGFALVTLMTAGLARVPFWKYMFMNLVGQFIWTGILLAVGYYFGNAYVAVNNIFSKISLVTLFILVILALHGYRKYLAKKAERFQI